MILCSANRFTNRGAYGAGAANMPSLLLLIYYYCISRISTGTTRQSLQVSGYKATRCIRNMMQIIM